MVQVMEVSLVGVLHIVGEDGEELPAGENGQVWFESETKFEDDKDRKKAAEAFNARGWSTPRSVDFVDELFRLPTG
jgi:long-chain acyl-CoA synthetase